MYVKNVKNMETLKRAKGEEKVKGRPICLHGIKLKLEKNRIISLISTRKQLTNQKHVPFEINLRNKDKHFSTKQKITLEEKGIKATRKDEYTKRKDNQYDS